MPVKYRNITLFLTKEYKTPIVGYTIITLEIHIFKFFGLFFKISGFAQPNTQYIVVKPDFSRKKGITMVIFVVFYNF